MIDPGNALGPNGTDSRGPNGLAQLRRRRRVALLVVAAIALATFMASAVQRLRESEPSAPPDPAASMPRCQASDLVMTASVPQPSYRVGEPVTITVELRNASDHTCLLPLGRLPLIPPAGVEDPVLPDCAGRVLVSDAGGTGVWTDGGPPDDRRSCEGVPPQLSSGETTTWTAEWLQTSCLAHTCNGPQVPPGTYTAVGYHLVAVSTPVTFQIVAS